MVKDCYLHAPTAWLVVSIIVMRPWNVERDRATGDGMMRCLRTLKVSWDSKVAELILPLIHFVEILSLLHVYDQLKNISLNGSILIEEYIHEKDFQCFVIG